ncbi:MAG TPA: hypothetical protein VLA00_03530 [Xanthobacteraceae bacterium]|nr:hypothetical protein [Xanthobacteraceae bacterium]
MITLLDEAIAKLRALPADRQEELARMLIEVADDEARVYELTPEQEAEVEQAMQEIREGRMEYASDEEVAALWKSFGL